MSDEQTIKFPLSKKLKAQFVADYEKIFFKVPPHNIKDEKLVEVVNANRDKLTGNEGTQTTPPQEGIQDAKNGDGGTIETNGDGIKPEDGTGANGAIENTLLPKPPKETTGVTEEGESERASKEREYQLERFKELHGEQADGSILSTDELTAMNLTKENFLTASKRYFDLFGKQPLEGMTNEQIFSAIANEEARQEEAKSKAKTKVEPIESSLEHDPQREMVIVNKKNQNDKRVINKTTFEFLKHDFDPVPSIPKELKNK